MGFEPLTSAVQKPRSVLARPDASGEFDVLQVLYEFLAAGSSTTCWLVLARLQYGCSIS